jgi:hypothetical protein
MLGATMSKQQSFDTTFGHIDLETGDAAQHRLCTYTLFTDYERRQEWKFTCELPVRVCEVLRNSDWEFVLRKLDTRERGTLSAVERIIIVAKMLGAKPADVQRTINKTVVENLWRIFTRKQLAAGNKAWLVPSSMVETRGPNG